MVFLGLLSYPLYLWHWPTLSFLHIVTLETARWPLRLAAIGLSLMLAYLTWRLVETPIRRQRPCLGMALALVGGLALTGFAGAIVQRAQGFPERGTLSKASLRPEAMDWPFWTNETCLKRYPYAGAQRGWWFCMASSDRPPNIILPGNSFAYHLYPGLVEELPGRSILSIGTCNPVRGLRWVST